LEGTYAGKGRTREPLKDRVANDLRSAGKKRDETRNVGGSHPLVGDL